MASRLQCWSDPLTHICGTSTENDFYWNISISTLIQELAWVIFRHLNIVRLEKNCQHFGNDTVIFAYQGRYLFWFKFYQCLFYIAPLTVSHHWFMSWLGTEPVGSHLLNQLWTSSLTHKWFTRPPWFRPIYSHPEQGGAATLVHWITDVSQLTQFISTIESWWLASLNALIFHVKSSMYFGLFHYNWWVPLDRFREVVDSMDMFVLRPGMRYNLC